MITELADFIRDEILQDPELSIDPGENLLLSGLLDSLALIRLVAHVEQEFDVEIPPGDVTLDNFATLSLIAGYLRSRLENAVA